MACIQGTKPLMYSHINNHNTGIHTYSESTRLSSVNYSHWANS